jgi:regulator of cell morphogenesis and NO signaling
MTSVMEPRTAKRYIRLRSGSKENFMTIDIDAPIGRLAAEAPSLIPLLEELQIDYCCNGSRTVREACVYAGVEVDQLLTLLSSTERSQEPAVEWKQGSLASLAVHIVEEYHERSRLDLSDIRPLLDRVIGIHGEEHAELAQLGQLFEQLKADMLPHMLKEEQVLFPYVTLLEQALDTGRPAPTPFFGTVRNPVRMMMTEHDSVAEILQQMRRITRGWSIPDDACGSYCELFRRLSELERYTHIHIHMENNIYFPRAVELEGGEWTAERNVASASGGCGSGAPLCGCQH